MGGSSPYEEPASAFVPQVRKCLMHSNKSPLTTMMKLLYGEPFGHGCRSIVSCLLQVVACGFWMLSVSVFCEKSYHGISHLQQRHAAPVIFCQQTTHVALRQYRSILRWNGAVIP